MELDRADLDAVLLSLAICALDRPGWREYLRGIAEHLDATNGARLFDQFRVLNEDRWRAVQRYPLSGVPEWPDTRKDPA